MSEPLHRASRLKRAALRLVHSLEETGPFAGATIDRAYQLAAFLALLNIWTFVLFIALVLRLPLSAALATSTGSGVALGLSVVFLIVFTLWIQRDVPGYRPRVEIGMETEQQSYARHMGISWYIGVSLVSALFVFYAYANWSR